MWTLKKTRRSDRSQLGIVLLHGSCRGHLAMSEDTFGCHNWGRYSWHLVGRGPGCRPSYGTGRPPPQAIIRSPMPTEEGLRNPALERACWGVGWKVLSELRPRCCRYRKEREQGHETRTRWAEDRTQAKYTRRICHQCPFLSPWPGRGPLQL